MQYELPIVVLVVDNGMYGTIRMHQERHYPGRVVGTDLAQSRLRRLRTRVRRTRRAGRRAPTDFPDALERALAAGVPALITLRIDPDAITPRTTLSAIRATAGFVSAARRSACRSQAEPISHYTDAVRAGNLLFVSGCVPVDGDGNGSSRRRRRAGAPGVRQRRRRARSRQATGSQDVVKVTVYSRTSTTGAAVNAVRRRSSATTRPASTLVEVSALAVPGARIEVEAVALLP